MCWNVSPKAIENKPGTQLEICMPGMQEALGSSPNLMK